jgi:hypothetical protein
MKFTSTLLAALSASTTVTAAAVNPLASREATKARLAARLDELHARSDQKHSHPAEFIVPNSPTHKGFAAASSGVTADIDTLNWSGAVVNGTNLNYVRGTWVVPTPLEAPGVDPSDQSGAIWVGIGMS